MNAHDRVRFYLDIAYRRVWYLVVPLVLSTIGSYLVLQRLPKVYQATTTILVLRQRVPEEFVKSTVTVPVAERIQSIEVQILSRTYLEEVARELGLLAPDASDTEAEAAWRRLAGKVSLNHDRQNLSWFKLTVEDGDPKRAATLTNRLAELFIEKSEDLQKAKVDDTYGVFGEWTAQRESALQKKEQELARYKKQYLFELPERETATLQLLQAANQRLDQLNGELTLKRERLKAVLSETRTQAVLPGAEGTPAGEDAEARSLAAAELELAALRSTYTEEHPIVRRKRQQIEDLHRRLAVVLGESGSDGTAPGTPVSPEVSRLRAEIRRLEAERAKEQANVDEYRSRLNDMPRREQELYSLTRDYEALKKQYDADLARREEAGRARDIVASNRGEQFQIQDPAREPTAPIRPQPLQVMAFGVLLGLGVGVGVVFVMEFLNVAVRSEEDLTGSFPDLTVLSVIPNLDEAESRRRGLGSRGKPVRGAAGILLALASGLGGGWP